MRFMIGKSKNTSHSLWAGIDEDAHHIDGRVCERRFPAYCAPFTSEAQAREALIKEGCDPDSIIAENRPKRTRRGR